MLASILKGQYNNLEIQSVLFSDNPKQDLMNRLRESYEKGTRCFYLAVYSHGSEQEILFKTALTAQDMGEIMKAFPDAHFYFSTIACYGGGMRYGVMDLLQKNPELKNRLNVFLQAKPNMPNLSGVRNLSKSSENFSTYYYLFLMQALEQGKTYGEALLEADAKTKEYIYGDPEAIIQGKLFTKNTQDGLEGGAVS